MYAQCVNSVYTVHNSKNCLPKLTNAGKKKKKSRKREIINVDVEPKRTHSANNDRINGLLNFWSN